MDARLTMPDLATTGSAIRVLRWLVKAGDSIKRGQVILEIETDKATMEVESTASGTLLEVMLKEGEEVEAGVLMATVRSSETAAPTALASAPEPSPAVRDATASVSAAASDQRAPAPARGGMFSRRSGAAAPPASALPTPVLSAAGRVAAQRLALSKQTIPHFYLTATANAEPMLARRNSLPGKPVWDAFFVRAVATSLTRFDRFTCRFEGGSLVRQESDAVGVAADVEGDLYVLRVEHPGNKTVDQISAEIRGEVEKIKQDAPGARRSKPGAISISNLGSTGVETFCAIINPPEAAILAIGAVAPRACVSGDQVKIQRCVTLTLSVDHRVVSGKYAANFLASVVQEIENL